MPQFLNHDATRCHLRLSKPTAAEIADALELVQSFVDESHLIKNLHQCRACGQLYFHVWFELLDWDDGDDRMYDFYIPVTTKAEIDRLREVMPPPQSIDLLECRPRLQVRPGSEASWAESEADG